MIVEVAHRHHVKVHAHVYQELEVRDAFSAGVDVLQHAGSGMPPFNPALVKEIAESGRPVVLTAARRMWVFPATREFPERLDDPELEHQFPPDMWNEVHDSFKRFHTLSVFKNREQEEYFGDASIGQWIRAGAVIGMGTDSGTPLNFHRDALWREAKVFVDHGMAAARVITALTWIIARILGKERELGTIEPGKLAEAVRFLSNPIVVPAASQSLGNNINGPSLIRVPEWVSHPLGRYYLYFAHHGGTFIRLAYSHDLRGPWRVYEPGTLRLDQAPRCHNHIASPDVHVDDARHEIEMYFHCPAGAGDGVDIGEQKTFIAASADGLKFTAFSQPLGPAYFRVFHHGEYFYAIVRGGGVLRSRDPRGPFEQGPILVKPDAGRILRHAALDLRGDLLRIYYSRIGDRPERILVTSVHLTPDWTTWKALAPATVLSPEQVYEGSDQPLEASEPDDAPGRVRQLRDPAIYREGRQSYLVYSIAGESGLAFAKLVE